MKIEALDAIANETMRPQALEAATTQHPEEDAPQVVQGTEKSLTVDKPHLTPTKPPTPFGQRTDGTESAAKVVNEVVHGLKVAVDGALTWAEKKTDELSSEEDSVGPYTSPATCVPSDLDVIGSGIMPVMPTQKQSEETGKGVDNQEQAKERKDSAAEPEK